ncbi:DAK2 domain-containing protein [Candidatus Epulonipiscium viviparus]|uniref:DAK2 domain-containing protein n=1 Tax=Candidatus Epulonipiscium viviparus TaxID=420336 RepID=UPI00016BFC7A|nr:DAK2 domain-containing protein [Candidatus Epulopiscium viviparus]
MNTTQAVDARLLQKMIVSAALLLDEKKEAINELNVFPVPDGDTGTNMSLTMLFAAKEVEEVENVTIESIGKAFAGGALRGARGNSGVILSQIIRGFVKGLGTNETVDARTVARATKLAVATAYKSVMKPKEGTILTVAKEISNAALSIYKTAADAPTFLKEVIMHGYKVLEQTQNMLPVLKEAGVVDAGGAGLMTILEGAARVILGEVEIEIKRPLKKKSTVAMTKFNTDDITFAYCTEFIVKREDKPYNEAKVKEYLDGIGDSIVVVSDDDYIKVHVHTNDPGNVLSYALKFGALNSVKIENMKEQHTAILEEESKDKFVDKKLGFVSVAAGEGFVDILKSLNVDVIVEGGQTMNPSTEDIIDAIYKTHAEQVILMPNNKNIVLTANQAAKVVEDEIKVIVIPTKSIVESISAMLAYDGTSVDAEAIAADMNEAVDAITTAQITIAVRDTTMNGEEIKEGQYLGILGGEIVSHKPSLEDTFIEVLSKLDQDSDIITIYYGEDIEEKSVAKYQDIVTKAFPQAEVELHAGKQPVYYFIISAE